MEPEQQTTQPTYTEIPHMPVQTNDVMSVKDWMITMLILIIPLVNIIMLFVWAFGGGVNQSKANYAKASLIWMLIVGVLNILIFIAFIGSFMSMFS